MLRNLFQEYGLLETDGKGGEPFGLAILNGLDENSPQSPSHVALIFLSFEVIQLNSFHGQM
jgi:hypothetical protein